MGMATHQRKIPTELKRRLIAEAGGKCANPGCSNWRVHIHHIKHWAAYKTHDQAHMIALCPSCHDAAHHGLLKITDDSLYEWKGIKRPADVETAHIYVEPAEKLKLILGGISIATPHEEAIIFQLPNGSELRLFALDGEWLQVTTALFNTRGQEILRVVRNNIRVRRDKALTFEHRAGRMRVTVPTTSEYMPQDALDSMRKEFSDYGRDDRLVALGLEVVRPGLIRVEGFWAAGGEVFVITPTAFCIYRASLGRPLCLFGEGEHSVINWEGPITSAIFNLASNT
jgi:hypothetical protein